MTMYSEDQLQAAIERALSNERALLESASRERDDAMALTGSSFLNPDSHTSHWHVDNFFVRENASRVEEASFSERATAH
jgi:hypothetical protein